MVIQNVLEGDKRIVRFKPSALTGGQDYNFRFTYNSYSAKAGNQGDMVTDLFETDFQVTTTAQFLDANGLLVQDLGSNVHSYYETLNGGVLSQPYAGNQPVGYDLDKDGIVDAGATPITFFVSTGVITQSGIVAIDRYTLGTGVFDGRYVNAVNPTQVEDNRLVAPVETYTHTIALKPGFTLSQASKDLGWVEDATGYHLTVTRDNNPVTDTNRLIPISFDIAGANVADIAGTKSLALTSTYTKTDGTVYSNSRTTTHNFRVLTAELTTGLYNVGHGILGNNSDSEIIKSYGRAYYDSRLDLSNQAMMEQKVSIDDRSFVWTTENDNEFYRRFWINTNDFSRQLDAGGVINLYNNDTGELITSITGANRGATHYSITIPEEDQVKSIRMETQGIYLWRTTEIGGQSIGMIRVLTDTFFDDWATIYNDTSINSLWSRTQLEMLDQADAVLVERHATTELVRTPMRVEMRDDNAINKTVTSRQDNSGFIFNEYNVTNLTTNKTALQDSKAFSALVGELKRAFLVSPELKPFGANLYSDVIYNYNGTGKDLYFFSIPHLPNVDNLITDNPRWTFANNFVPNGSYTVTDIGYWDEIDPNIQPTDGINLGTVNGVTITAANSTTKINTITLQASEASGVISKVKADAAASYALNTSGHQAQDVIDFQLTYSNIGRTDASQVSVLTSLPTNGDSLLAGGNRNSQFTVSLTGPVTPPTGWTAVYTTATGTATQMEAGTWLMADQITDWSTIRAIKYISTAPVMGGTSVNFNIDNAVIQGDALQGEKAYLSSASSTNGAPFIESNTVLIQMATTIPDGTVTIQYVNEAGEVIATEKVLKNDIKSDYDASNQATYYPTNITGTDGLPYVYVETDPTSAPNTGSYSETPQVITHVYKLVPQTATFTYLNVTDPAKPVQLGVVDSETGGSGQDIAYDTTSRINDYLKQGYELVSNDYTPDTTFDTNKNVDQAFTIKLRHKIEPATPDTVDPDTNAPVELSRTVTRTIEYKYIDKDGREASATVTQTATFTRTATVDMVTKKVTYTKWTSEDAELDAVDSPVIDGYTADEANVPALTVNADSANSKVLVVYTPKEQVGKVTYIDETTGTKLETVDLNGVTDQKIGYDPAKKIEEYEAKGYVFVSEDVPEDGVYDNIDGNSQDYVVVLRHKIEPATPDTVDPKTKAPVELSRTVTRTIEYKYIDENGAEASATVTQTATFTRTATVDKVTGEVTYADWTSADAELDRVDSPAIQGYTPNMTNVPALTVNADTEDQSVVVIYTPDIQKASVTYTDETTGATLEITNLTGETDAAIGYTTADRIAYYKSIGYELVSDNYPNDVVYDKDGNVTQEFQVVLKHIVTPVTPADPTNPKDGSTLELTRTVTRTIEYKYIDENGAEASATVTQTVTFTRTATVDMVTGQVTYADWTTDNASLAQVDSPAIDGYTPNLSSIPAMTVDPNQSDIHTVVIYNADQQKARVTYYDQTSGRVLETSDLTGLSDEAIDYTTTDRIAYYESIGYRLVSNDYPDAPVYDKDGNVLQEYQVVLEHIINPVTPDNPINPKTNQELELTRTVTRTIQYKYIDENGQEASATVTQTATFTRTATVNMVTGEVIYGGWASADAELDAVDSPVIDGYTPNLATVPALTVDADSVDSTVIVVYTQNTQPNPNVDPKPVPTPDQAKPTTPANHVPTEQVKNVEESTEKPSLSKAEVLPNTGQEGSSSIFAIGVALAGLSLAILKKKKKEDDI
ncbi:LPXTG cell wall anchor domain-containing protein [Streptococcus suis]|nr:LPXTG cell wall anchor domain-containing protein [Streptococcus suis]